MKYRIGMKLEDIYPNKRCRDAADKAVDAMVATEPMTAFLDAWDQAYRDAGGKSPFAK